MSARDLIKLTQSIRELTKEANKMEKKIQKRIKDSNKIIKVLRG